MNVRPLAVAALLAVVPLVGAVGVDGPPDPIADPSRSAAPGPPALSSISLGPVLDPGVAGAAARPRVLVYGDSLLWEAQEVVRSLVGDRADVEVEAVPGSALCDHAATAVDRAAATGARLVVLQFSGNAFTPCMRGLADPDDITDRYRADAQRVVAQLARAGVRVVLVTPPPSLECELDADRRLVRRAVGELPGGCDDTTHPLEAVYREVAEAAREDGADVVAVDGARGLTSRTGGWTKVVPCGPGEGRAEGCRDGLIDVRAADTAHFCPPVATSAEGVVAGCATYSAGALRFATTIATAVIGPDPR